MQVSNGLSDWRKGGARDYHSSRTPLLQYQVAIAQAVGDIPANTELNGLGLERGDSDRSGRVRLFGAFMRLRDGLNSSPSSANAPEPLLGVLDSPSERDHGLDTQCAARREIARKQANYRQNR